jgi:hypothetical protein
MRVYEHMRVYHEHMRVYREHMRVYHEYMRVYREHMRVYHELYPRTCVYIMSYIPVHARIS